MLSAKEFSEWVEFYHIEPFGWEAECYPSAVTSATLANIHRDPKKKTRPFDAIDFIPGARRAPKKLDPRKLKADLLLAYGGLNAKNNLQHTGRKGDAKPPSPTRAKGRKTGRGKCG